MASTLKVDTIVHPSGTPDNLTLDNAGNVTVGNNLTVNGSQTFTGNMAVGGTLTVTGAGSIQGLTVGKGAGAAADATVLGVGALASNAAGTTNTAIGYVSFGQANTNSNTGVGAYSGRYSTGALNIAIGQQALQGTNGSATGSCGNMRKHVRSGKS